MSDESTTAQSWFEDGMNAVGLSRHADTHSELLGDLERAVGCFDRALALDPAHVDAQWQRGLALAALDQHDAALDSFLAVARARPTDADVHLAVAQAFGRAARPELALEAFEQALALRPDDEEARYGRAEQLSALRRDAEAVAAWDLVLAARDNRTLNVHGQRVRVVTGDFRRARALFERACCLARLGHADARAAFTETLGDTTLSVEDVGDALRDFSAAREGFAAWLKTQRTDEGPWYRAARAWLRAGDAAEALRAWDVVLGRSPSNAHAWLGKAEAHLLADELAPALAACQRALALQPDFIAASHQRARIEARLRERDAP